MTEPTSDYSASEITVLKGAEAVRKRPAMYIGSTGKSGYHHLIWEIVDNSIDEALAGFCKNITVTLQPDNYVEVQDDGRGIPVELHPEEKKSGVEVVLTILHAGGKFDDKLYQASGGLHGVGAAVVNFLSSRLDVAVKRDGGLWIQSYARGVPKAPLKRAGDAKGTGTFIRFTPDPEVFKELEAYDFSIIAKRLQELAYLNSGVTITLNDKRGDKPVSKVFTSAEGLAGFVKDLNKGKATVHPPIEIKDREKNVEVRLAIQYNQGLDEKILTFVNSINTIEGGTHLSGFRAGLTKALNNYYSSSFDAKGKLELTSDDFREGLAAVVSIKMGNPQFESQTKIKLGNTEIRWIVEKVVYDRMASWLRQESGYANIIMSRALVAAKAREEARKAKDLVRRKSIIESASFALPGKLSDCSSSKAEECELFLVEGESAGGTAKAGRDRRIQAILPLKGKVINAEKTTLDKVLNNAEINAIKLAVGTGIMERFDASRLRYHKIILMTDADVDGSHIKTLLLTAFFRLMPDLLKQGYLYCACPPLYRAEIAKGKNRGHVTWLYNDDDLARFRKATGLDKVEFNEKIKLQRFKGLGEMSAEQLWDTTMNPERRVLKRLVIDDEAGFAKLIELLMGGDVPERRDFIIKNCLNARTLDI